MRMQATFVALGAVSTLAGAAVTTVALVIARAWPLGQRLNVLVLGVLIVTTVATSAGYRLAQAFRRRLFEIEEAAVLMAGGRLHHRVARFGENDEIDQVAAEFNRMGEQLEAQVAMLQQLAEENQALTEQVQRTATMEERQRLARELHDSVSQELFALTMLSETALRQLEAGSVKLHENLLQMAELANRAQREMRALLLHLRPVELAGRSFQEATASFLQAVEERHQLACHFSFPILGSDTLGEIEDLPPGVEEQLFRIVQEAVANVLKHANATALWVNVNVHSASYELTISDNGVGITRAVEGTADHYGILAMRERCARLGGTLEFFSRNPGTTLRVVIPRADRGEEG